MKIGHSINFKIKVKINKIKERLSYFKDDEISPVCEQINLDIITVWT